MAACIAFIWVEISIKSNQIKIILSFKKPISLVYYTRAIRLVNAHRGAAALYRFGHAYNVRSNAQRKISPPTSNITTQFPAALA
jgi:hypothetical protein